ncbi:protein ANTHESIS POMOTING FACTOR 1-like [Alnus glutinosa]|uniref:protein ANTHESIS POMOTING FACTOR 1-like n=1 Tax=Alnus glutinosa TaxID=3517 RepID=UPI002D784356|nr:protein ANTHESIS POMOTING FACTOR 1-like [Alnus glutinosa]
MSNSKNQRESTVFPPFLSPPIFQFSLGPISLTLTPLTQRRPPNHRPIAAQQTERRPSPTSCLKTTNSKKYGVDLVCFTSHPKTVIYSSKNDNKYLRYFKGHHDRVVSLSLCSRKECFISGSLDQTVLLWDQQADKCQSLLRVQGRPATSYGEQGLVFAIASGGYIRMFDARKYEMGPFDIFSVGGETSDANVVKFSSDGRVVLLTTMDGHIHVLDSFLN